MSSKLLLLALVCSATTSRVLLGEKVPSSASFEEEEKFFRCPRFGGGLGGGGGGGFGGGSGFGGGLGDCWVGDEEEEEAASAEAVVGALALELVADLVEW